MARIVHIEDDPANRLLVRKLLDRAGHEVLDAADGIEGIRVACTSSPDLVLVDLNIPGLDGFEVTLRLRGEQRLEGVPIVAITAEGDRDTSLSVGCDGFLQKPIDARTFAATIARYLGGEKEAPPAQRSVRLEQQSQRIVAHLEQKVAELMQANERLREADAARAAFYRNISHELATPMTPIVGYARLLLDEELGELQPAQKRALGAMEECITRLRRIIDNLLDVTGLETGRMAFAHRRYDFAALVRGAIATVRRQLGDEPLTIIEQIPDRPMPAVGDDERLARAVGQLLDNAVKFTPKRGAVGIRVEEDDGGYVLCVADTGPGVPEALHGRIFEAFYQVDGSVTREHGGTGVGLAIARRTALGLGGDLHLGPKGSERFGGVAFGGAAFYLRVARQAPNDLGIGTMTRTLDGAYLDHNATTPPRPEVLERMAAVARDTWANPSSVHRVGQAARRWVDRARASVAALVGFHRRDVVLCSGGTEANNLALASAPAIVTSRLEHPSIVAVAEARESTRWIEVPPDGRLRVEAVEAALADLDPQLTGGVVVAVQAVNHETGVVQPIEAIAEVAHERGLWLHVDTVQAVGRLPIGAWSGADSVVVAGHKIRGPKGIGALITRPGASLRPVLRGGGQERGLRPGTQDASLCAGLTVAAEHAADGALRYRALVPMRDALEARARSVAKRHGVSTDVNGDVEHRAPHVTNISFAGHASPELCAALDLLGVAVASGSACAAGTAEPSPVVEAMLGRERARSAMRISLGETTTKPDVERFVEALDEALSRPVPPIS